MVEVRDSLEIAGFEKLAADPTTNLFVGRRYWNTTSSVLRVYDAGIWSTVGAANQSPGTVKYDAVPDADLDLTGVVLDALVYGYLMYPTAPVNDVPRTITMTTVASGEFDQVALKFISYYYSAITINTPDGKLFRNVDGSTSATLTLEAQEFIQVYYDPDDDEWVVTESAAEDIARINNTLYISSNTDLTTYFAATVTNEVSRFDIPIAIINESLANGTEITLFDALTANPFVSNKRVTIYNPTAFTLDVTAFGAQTIRNAFTGADQATWTLGPYNYLVLVLNQQTASRYEIVESDDPTITQQSEGGGWSLRVVTNADSPVTADIQDWLLTDTTGGPITVNLPDLSAISPFDDGNSYIRISDCESNWQTDAVTLVPFSGQSIDGNAADETMVLDVEAQHVAVAKSSASEWCFDTSIQPIVQTTGEGGDVTGKNYILNPDAAEDLSDITASDNAISLERTDTPSELAEASKGTGIKISIASGAANDYVEWDADAIDDADGGKYGDFQVRYKTISGYTDGDITFQAYDSTTGLVLDEQDILEGSDTIYFDVPFVAGNTIKARAVFNVADSPGLVASGVTIKPEAQSNAALISRATVLSPIPWASGSAGTTSEDQMTWRTVGGYFEAEVYFQQTVAGTGGSGDLQLTIPNGYTIDPSRAIIYDGSPSAIQDAKYVLGSGLYSPSADGTSLSGLHFVARSSTTIGFVQHAYSTDTLSILSAAVLGNANVNISGTLRVPITQLVNAHSPSASDVLFDSARARYYRAAAGGYTSGTTFVFDTEDTVTYQAASGISISSGVVTVTNPGTYDITAVIGANPAWAANTQLELWVDRGSGAAQERIMARPGSSDFLLSGNTSVTLAAGDTVQIRANATVTILQGSTTCYLEIERRSDYAARKVSLPFANGMVLMDTGSSTGTGHGSTATKIRNFTNVTVFGESFIGTSDSVNGGQVVLNRDMVVSCTYSDGDTLTADNNGISVNSSVTTDMTSLPAYDGTSGRLISATSQTNNIAACSATVRLKKGDIIRPHTNGTQNRTDSRVQFIVQEVSPLGI